MREKIKKIAEKIWDIWAAIAVLFAIGALFGGLEQVGWIGTIVFLTLIIIYTLYITRKDRELIAREKTKEREWKKKLTREKLQRGLITALREEKQIIDTEEKEKIKKLV